MTLTEKVDNCEIENLFYKSINIHNRHLLVLWKFNYYVIDLYNE